MSVSRISTNYAFIRSLNNITDTFLSMDKLREKLNTGKEINRPSDDPAGMQKVFSLGTSIKQSTQYQENINRALGKLNATSTMLGRVEDVLSSIINLATTAASSATTSAERAASANEVDILLQELVNLANSTHQGKFLFGGINTTSGTAPLSLPYNIQYDANGRISGVVPNPRGINTLVNTTIMRGIRESMNISGSAPFQPNGAKGSGDIFNLLVNLRNNLNANNIDALKANEKQLMQALNRVTEEDTIVGSKINRLEISYDTLDLAITNETAEKSGVEDSDYARLLLEYNTAEVLLNAALSATSTLLQSSLMNFI